MNAINRSQTKTVLFISHSADNYGAQKSLLSLVENLPSEIRPVLLFPSRGFFQTKMRPDIQHYTLFYLPWISSRLRPFKYILVTIVNLLTMFTVRSICKKEKVDLIYSNTLAMPLGLMIAKCFKLPHIIHVREYIGPQENACFIISQQKALKNIINNTSSIICNSKSVAAFYNLKEYIPKVNVVYNGIEPISENCTRKKLSDNIITMVGYIEERKNQEEAIRAIHLLAQKKIPAQLNLAGTGDSNYIKKLNALIMEYHLESRILFTGRVENINELYLKSSLLVHCAKREPWGRVIVEAMMCRCPVISADSDGAKEIITHGVNGLLYTKGNHIQLAELIQNVLENKIDVNRITEQGYLDARQRFSIDRYVKEISNVINCTFKEFNKNEI